MSAPPWTPIPKCIQREILRCATIPYIEAVAYLSVSLDCNNKAPVSIAGYAALWGWSQGKVRRFLGRIGARIEYPESTKHRQNQRGEIVIQMMERSSVKNGEMILMNFSELGPNSERSKPKGGEISERSRVATINNNNKIKKIPFSEIVNHLNQRSGKNFRSDTKTTRSCISARWNEGFRLDDFCKVINSRCEAWGSDCKWSEYLRPTTLFGSKFEGYLNTGIEKPSVSQDETTEEERQHRQAVKEVAAANGLS